MRVLFVRSDSYGDLVLFAPALAWLRSQWPNSKLGLLLKEQHQDLIPLLPEGIEYLLTAANPYRESVTESRDVAAITEQVQAFAPDMLVAPTFEKTWMHAAAALAVPEVRRVSVGPSRFDSLTEHWLRQQGAPSGEALYPEIVRVDKVAHELEKIQTLLAYLSGNTPPRLQPGIRVPPANLSEADALLTQWGLRTGEFIICNPTGAMNVAIKSWPAESFGTVLREVCESQKLGVVLCGHATEKAALEAVKRSAGDSCPAVIWQGNTGELPLLAALTSKARFYFGNDTATAHLAEAVKIPAVVIYGGGTWPRFTPSLPSSASLVHPLPCFGCGWDCHFGDAPCVKLIYPDDVIAALNRLLSDVKDEDRHEPMVVRLGKLPATWLESIERSRRKYEMVEGERTALHAQVVQLTATAQACEKRHDADLDQLSRTIADAERRLISKDEELQTLNVFCQETIAAKESLLLRSQKELREIAAELENAGLQLGLKDQELQALNVYCQETIAAKESLLLRSQKELREIAAELTNAQLQLAAQDGQLRLLNESHQRVEAESSLRYDQIQALTALAQKAQAESAARGNQIALLTEQIHAAEATCRSLEVQRDALRTEGAWALNRAEAHIAALRLRLLKSDEEARLSTKLLRLNLLEASNSRHSACVEVPPPPESPADTEVVFNVEAAIRESGSVFVAGWAFLRSSRDCRLTALTLALRTGDRWWVAPVYRIVRPDVEEVFPPDDGVTRHREHSGFQCRFRIATGDVPLHVRLIMYESGSSARLSKLMEIPAR